jgi:Mrp family chromosome partitioning ATPase
LATAARIALRPTGRPGDQTMKSSAIEELKTVLRRSLPLILGVILVGMLGLNLIRQLGGPAYNAEAKVLLGNEDLQSAVLGISRPYQDPARIDQAEQNLVDSPQLYDTVARSSGGRLGSGSEIKSQTAASVSNNVVTFSATTGNAERSVQLVNLVASLYPGWRAGVSQKAIDSAISQVRGEIARSGSSADLSKQLQQLQMVKSVTSGDTLFVERATDAAKTRPRPVSDTILGGAIGLVIALLIVGARELFDTTVRSEEDVEDALNTQVLSTVESLPRRLRTSMLGPSGSRFNDEYALLAANIAQIFDGQEGPVQLAVTSAVPGEGKTTTATNLAAALSLRGANVVLADFDLRKPSVADLVGIPIGSHGVAEVLKGTAQVRSVLWQVRPNGAGWYVDRGRNSSRRRSGSEPQAKSRSPQVAATQQTIRAPQTPLRPRGSLAVMPGGSASVEVTPLFSRLPGVLDQLTGDLDFVVVDTPPALLTAGMAELAQSVDGVIVVVRHGVVHRRRLRALGQQARSWRARVLGAVLNDSPDHEGGYLSYYNART